MEHPEFVWLSVFLLQQLKWLFALLTESHGLYQYYLLKTLSEHYANIIAQFSEQ